MPSSHQPMSWTRGIRLGPYEILSVIGAGGMGEVYRARDTKLGRDVAIKIMPASLASDAERRARFEREARVLASVNHPNIGAIFGVEERDGVTALVLELVEGETLAVRLSARPPSITEALTIARQIADALDAAHQRGIVHRDVKPANIIITPDGTVKVLDFGLAKAGESLAVSGSAGPGWSSDSQGSVSANSPTVMPPTVNGALLGTLAYMSPEQARGKNVDKRADIWAFGCVLYEMLTGRAAFAGETVGDVLAATLDREPEWILLPANLAFNIRRLLQRCLDKNLKRRLRDIADARLEVDDALAGTASAAPASMSVAARSIRFERLTDAIGINESPAISPDGKMVAFVARAAGRRHIWIRMLAGGAPLQVTRDDVDHEQPRWTPDSSALLYYAPAGTPGDPGTVWEISALGGPPRPIASSISGADVSHDGRRLALFQVDGQRPRLVWLSRDGSHSETVASLLAGIDYSCPRWSPDDRWIAFQGHGMSVTTVARAADDHPGDRGAVPTYFDQRLQVASSAGGTLRELARGAILKGVSWLPDGSGLVYASSAGSTLPYPPTFNLRTVACDGTGDRAVTFGDASYVEPDVDTSGRMVASRIRSASDIWRFPVDRAPAENVRDAVRITQQTGQVQTPSVSSDGREVVYLSDNGGHANLWVARTDGTTMRQITFERDPAVALGVPVWSSAGPRIAFLINRPRSSLWLINSDGAGLRQLLDDGFYACWSGDGQWLYFTTLDGPWRISKIAVATGTIVPVRGDNPFGSAVSYDGETLYYARAAMGDFEVCKASPEDGPSIVLARISRSRVPLFPSLFHPVISPDGRWLAMPLADGAASNLWLLSTEDGSMRPVTDFGDCATLIARRISWSPDGQCLYAAVANLDADVILLDGLLA